MNSGEYVRRVPYKKKGTTAVQKNMNLSTAKKSPGVVGSRTTTIVPTFEVNLIKSASKSTPKKSFIDSYRRYASPKPTNTLPK